MGLRIFDPEAAQPKPRTDPTACSRSTIRRQRTFSRASPGSDTSALLGRGSPRFLLDLIRPSDAALNVVAANPDVETDANHAHALASNRRRLESGRALLRDALSYERPGQRMREPPSGLNYSMGAPLPPVPESTDYVHARVNNVQSAPGRSASPTLRYMPTPPYTSGDHSPMQRAPTPPAASVSLTPRFAPAYRSMEYGEGATRSSNESADAELESSRRSLPASNVNELPNLRRMHSRNRANGHSSEHPRRDRFNRRPAPALDGLGDRERSFSPDDDAWDTLLTTITPDSHFPSTNSSFASASASASSLASFSASSFTTLLPSPAPVPVPTSVSDNLEPFPICDNSSESEASDTETVSYDIEEHTSQSDLPVRDPHRYSPNVIALGREAGRMVEDYFIGARRRAIEGADREPALQQVHSILERLARREDIPDEWWAAAGLSRNIGTSLDQADREQS